MRYSSPPCLVAAAVFAAGLLYATSATAGGWTQPEDAYYAKIWTLAVIGDQAFEADGDIVPSESYANLSLNYYLEYGLTDQWTLLSSGRPFGYASYDEESTAFVGPHTFGARRAFLTQPFALAIQASYGFEPGVGEENLADPASEFLYIPAVSSHRGEWEVQFGKGLPFGWTSFHAGQRFYSDATLSPELTAFAQIGVNLPFGLVSDLHAAANIPLEDVTVTNVAGAGNTEYLGIGVGLSKWFGDHIGIHLAFEGAAYAESNAGAPAISLGVEAR